LNGSSSFAEPPAADAPRPDVILDVDFDAGALYLVVANIGARPAVGVTFRFDEPFKGLGGTQDMTRLPLLRGSSSWRPGRRSARYSTRALPISCAASRRSWP
jgi:hypothetical protein